MNKIDDKIERRRKIGEKNATLILGKLPPDQDKKRDQLSTGSSIPKETITPIKCSLEKLKYPLKG